ncbi:MAG: heat-inducible transcription repressor HrcA [Ignavibacterium sp.]|nr:MAG: heat-inducible transcription repressor HrcA [Ignavibacterium sp.]
MTLINQNIEDLNDREKNILRSIVQQFILTASPVGSRNITKKYHMGISPATVRNIMADLEDSGFINHPHTSAGRVPTDKGYRYYVDSLMELKHLKNSEKGLIDKSLTKEILDTEELFRVASALLSTITKQLACVTYPDIDSGIFEKLQIVSLTSTRLMVVISIKSGLVRTITLEITSDIKESHLESVQNLLNERLVGLRLSDIRMTLKDRLKDAEEIQKPIIRLFIDSVDKVFKDDRKTENLILMGARNVIKQPEFENPENIEGIIELMENKDIIIHIMEKTGEINHDDVYISIGSENEDIKMKDYSLISKEYEFGDTIGTLGIVGPKRMEYSKVVTIVDYIAKMLSEFLKSPTK